MDECRNCVYCTPIEGDTYCSNCELHTEWNLIYDDDEPCDDFLKRY